MVDPVTIVGPVLTLLWSITSKLKTIKTQYQQSQADITSLERMCGLLEPLLLSIKSLQSTDPALQPVFEKYLNNCSETILKVSVELSKLDPNDSRPRTFQLWWNGEKISALLKELNQDQLNINSLLLVNSAYVFAHEHWERSLMKFKAYCWHPYERAGR